LAGLILNLLFVLLLWLIQRFFISKTIRANYEKIGIYFDICGNVQVTTDKDPALVGFILFSILSWLGALFTSFLIFLTLVQKLHYYLIQPEFLKEIRYCMNTFDLKKEEVFILDKKILFYGTGKKVTSQELINYLVNYNQSSFAQYDVNLTLQLAKTHNLLID